MDGASNLKGVGAGVSLLSLEVFLHEQAIRLGFKASNNEAKYEAFLVGLRIAKILNIQDLIVHCGS